MLQGLTRDRFVDLCFFNSLVIFSSSELGSRGLLYSSSSSLSELSFSFSVSESCFFFAEAISAACRFRHLVRLFWNQTWAPAPGTAQLSPAATPRPPTAAPGPGRGRPCPPVRGPGGAAPPGKGERRSRGVPGAAGRGLRPHAGVTRAAPPGCRQPEPRDGKSRGFAGQTSGVNGTRWPEEQALLAPAALQRRGAPEAFAKKFAWLCQVKLCQLLDTVSVGNGPAESSYLRGTFWFGVWFRFALVFLFVLVCLFWFFF